MTEHIVKHEDALGFIFGGNALFTVKNPKTENRFTFKVTKHKKEDVFFVKVLTNPDVYEFIGSIIATRSRCTIHSMEHTQSISSTTSWCS